MDAPPELADLRRVVLSYAVFGIIVRNGFVVETAPIGRWMIGKPINAIRAWIIGKRGTLEDCSC
jgi:hypothetical protein